MKKIVVIVSVIVVIFAALVLITNYQQKKNSEGNPFGKDRINPETQKQLDDPLYQNIITPDDLEDRIANGESTTVYFYSPTCPACRQTTPVLVPMAEEMDVDLKKYNLLEFDEGWEEYRIRVTPTIIHFENGEEVNRLEEYHQDQSVFSSWLEEIKETPSE